MAILVCTTSLCKSEATVWSFSSHLFEAKPTNLKYYLPQSESDWSKLLLWICWLGSGRVSFCARTKTTRTSPRFFVPSEPLHQKCELRFPGPCRLVEPSGTKSIPKSELRFGASANMRNQVEPNPEPNQFTIVSWNFVCCANVRNQVEPRPEPSQFTIMSCEIGGHTRTSNYITI